MIKILFIGIIIGFSALQLKLVFWRSGKVRKMLNILSAEKTSVDYRLHSLGFTKKLYFAIFLLLNISMVIIYFITLY